MRSKKSVNIAKFKAEMGKYMDLIRKGEEIIVLDRRHPLAKIIPFRSERILEVSVRKGKGSVSQAFKDYLSKKEDYGTDSLSLLLDDRKKR